MQLVKQQFIEFRQHYELLLEEIGKVFVGQRDLVERVLTCLLSGGHVLLEGMPGVGKTLLVKTLSQTLDLDYARIQCTPDLMPSDVLGTNMLYEDEAGHHSIRFEKGPIFANIVLADEVNRATPKTQSAFLEAMQERRVTLLGKGHPLEEPFMVLATQNPIEMEGTYRLPEAQLDRFFFKLTVKRPDVDELSRVMDLTTGEGGPSIRPVCPRETVLEMSNAVRKVKIAEDVKRYALRLVLGSDPEGEEAPPVVKRCVKYGASPRAAQSMILGGKVRALYRGRYNVSFEDITEMALPSLAHRVILNFEGEMSGMTAEKIVKDLASAVRPE